MACKPAMRMSRLTTTASTGRRMKMSVKDFIGEGKTSNNQHPTSNIQREISAIVLPGSGTGFQPVQFPSENTVTRQARCLSHYLLRRAFSGQALVVGCWLLDV